METQLGPGESALSCWTGLLETTRHTGLLFDLYFYIRLLWWCGDKSGHCWALRFNRTTVTAELWQLEILFLPLSSAVAAMFPRQSGFRGRTPLLCLLIHSRLETWTQTQLHIVSTTVIQLLFLHCFYKTCVLPVTGGCCLSLVTLDERQGGLS